MVRQCREITTQKCSDTQEIMSPKLACRGKNWQHCRLSPTCRRHVADMLPTLPANTTLFFRSYRGTFRMYLWYFKKKGVNVGNPQHKNMCRDQICVATTGQCQPKVPTFGCRGDMSPTCWHHSQPRPTDAANGQVCAPYCSSGHHGHQFWLKKLSWSVVKPPTFVLHPCQ